MGPRGRVDDHDVGRFGYVAGCEVARVDALAHRHARVVSQAPVELSVADVDGLVVGLVVDAATDVIVVDASHMEDAPVLATQAGYDLTSAVIRNPDEEPIPILSLENLIEVVRGARDAVLASDAAWSGTRFDAALDALSRECARGARLQPFERGVQAASERRAADR